MKTISIPSISVLLAAGAALCAVSCGEETQKIDPVDLRYDAQDEYRIDAISPEPVSFEVRSLYSPWEVYSYHPDWCEIDPAAGEMEEKSTVTVRYTDNEQLDDRTDTLVIQSDYWIGKWVTVIQKGTAFLTVDKTGVNIGKEGDETFFLVSSNQKWTVEVTEGDQWLSVADGASGELNGTVTLAASENRGEIRYGAVTVYDRHGVEAATVAVTQDGAQLDPETDELRVLFNVTRVELPVVSNTEWVAEKDNEDIVWYDFENPSNSGSATLVINLRENASSSMRQTTFTLRTVAEDGTEAVERTITLKQANEAKPTRYYFSEGLGSWSPDTGGSPAITDGGVVFSGNQRVAAYNMEQGTYTFKVSLSSDGRLITYYCVGSNEVRYHMNAATKKLQPSTTPWNNLPEPSFDPGVPHEATMVMTDADNGFVHLQWLLDGNEIAQLASTSNMPLMTWGSSMTILIGSTAGTVTIEWYEFTPSIDWGD